MSEPRQLQDFLGRWSVSRRIAQDGGATAEFVGQASWQAHAGRALYYEAGLLTLEGHAPMQATRSYIWDEALNVFFEDGRFFHAVPPMGGQAHHHCAPDDYWVHYDFSPWPRFTATWRVKGARKDYEMRSEFTPL